MARPWLVFLGAIPFFLVTRRVQLRQRRLPVDELSPIAREGRQLPLITDPIRLLHPIKVMRMTLPFLAKSFGLRRQEREWERSRNLRQLVYGRSTLDGTAGLTDTGPGRTEHPPEEGSEVVSAHARSRPLGNDGSERIQGDSVLDGSSERRARRRHFRAVSPSRFSVLIRVVLTGNGTESGDPMPLGPDERTARYVPHRIGWRATKGRLRAAPLDRDRTVGAFATD
jgi:hypothetical protein